MMRYSIKENVVSNIQKSILPWIAHVESGDKDEVRPGLSE